MWKALGVLCLLLGFFFVYKTFTAPNILGRDIKNNNKPLQLYGEGAGKVDCGTVAIMMFFGAYVFLNKS